MADFFSKIFDNILRIISIETWTSLPKKYVVRHIDKFDDRFDLLWATVSNKFPIISHKTQKLMNWRYINSPYRSYKIIGIFEKQDENLLGYIIYHIPDNEEGNVVIYDCLFDPDQNVFSLLLLELIRYFRKEKMRALSFVFFGSEAIQKVFARCGFRKKPFGTTIMINCGDNNQLLSVLQNPENWFLTEGDDNGVL